MMISFKKILVVSLLLTSGLMAAKMAKKGKANDESIVSV